MTELLNTAQRSSLTIRLRMFEMSLRQANAWLQSEPINGILYRYSINLSPEQRAAIRAQIQVALAEIAQLAEKFDLVPYQQDFGPTFVGQMSVEWSSLCEVRADHLRRYGDVHPRWAAQLDAEINTLLERAAALTDLCSVAALR